MIKNGTEINYNSTEFRQNLQTNETYFLTKEDIASLNVSYDLGGMYRFHIGKSPDAHPSEIRKLVHPDGVYTFKGQIVKWMV